MTDQQVSYMKLWRKNNRDKINRTKIIWNRTFFGCLSRKYNNMTRRVEGRDKISARLYKGLPILSREEFMLWSRSEPSYAACYKLWAQSGYSTHLSPSIDRIDSTKGYVLGNMIFISMQENRLLGLSHEMKLRKERRDSK